jgi:hypothetical protein
MSFDEAEVYSAKRDVERSATPIINIAITG